MLAAQSGLAFCNNRVAVPMPGMDMSSMPGMSMSAPGVMICPVVLVLIVASALLAAAAVAIAWRDPERALAGRAAARALVRVPPVRAILGLVGAGAFALAVMRAVDGEGAPGFGTCALLCALLLLFSSIAVALSMGAAQLFLMLGRRLIVAIVAAILNVPRAGQPAHELRLAPVCGGTAMSSLLAQGRGLRAPPRIVR